MSLGLARISLAVLIAVQFSVALLLAWLGPRATASMRACSISRITQMPLADTPFELLADPWPEEAGWLVKWTAASLIGVALLTGCIGDKTYRWEEVVELSTKERLKLDRSVRLERTSAPFNPFKSSWLWRESTFTVSDGPPDLKGVRYHAPLLPMLLERDPSTKRLVVISKAVYCFDYKRYTPDEGWNYLAFELGHGTNMQQVPIPEWAWGRRLNLLKPNSDETPPRSVLPGYADDFNRNKSRGEPAYFQVQRTTPTNCKD